MQYLSFFSVTIKLKGMKGDFQKEAEQLHFQLANTTHDITWFSTTD